MTRGHMKMQAKAKNLKKQEALKKSVGHDQKGACLKSLIYKCTICMVRFYFCLNLKYLIKASNLKLQRSKFFS